MAGTRRAWRMNKLRAYPFFAGRFFAGWRYCAEPSGSNPT
jgi:hypothetical protein